MRWLELDFLTVLLLWSFPVIVCSCLWKAIGWSSTFCKERTLERATKLHPAALSPLQSRPLVEAMFDLVIAYRNRIGSCCLENRCLLGWAMFSLLYGFFSCPCLFLRCAEFQVAVLALNGRSFGGKCSRVRISSHVLNPKLLCLPFSLICITFSTDNTMRIKPWIAVNMNNESALLSAVAFSLLSNCRTLIQYINIALHRSTHDPHAKNLAALGPSARQIREEPRPQGFTLFYKFERKVLGTRLSENPKIMVQFCLKVFSYGIRVKKVF